MSANAAAYNSLVVPCLAGSLTASANGKSIDTLGCETLTAIYQFGTTTTGTSGTVTLTLEDSADDSSFALITGATSGALTTDAGGMNAKRYALVLNCKGRRRYVRMVATIAGTVATGATGPQNNGGTLIASNRSVSLPTTHFDGVVHVVTV